MNKPINPALTRIQKIKATSGSGLGRSFQTIEPFDNPIIQQAAEEIAAERALIPIPEHTAPMLPHETPEEYKVRMLELETEAELVRLTQMQLGRVEPTQTGVYIREKGDALVRLFPELKDDK
jgi:hypothetical protein